MTALHAAVSQIKDATTAVLLIEAGADVDLKDKVSPVHSIHGHDTGTEQ